MLDISVIILAGGKNARMKRDKAFLMIDDQLFIDNTVAKAEKHFREVIVVTNRPEAYSYLDIVVTTDLIPKRGPLAGIHAGLTIATYPYSFVVACDMPFISMDLGVLMAQATAGYDAIVPVMDGGLQPLHAIYSKTCIPVIEDNLSKNIRRTTALYEKLKIKQISEKQLEQWGISPWVFFNVNTPEELEIAKTAIKELK